MAVASPPKTSDALSRVQARRQAMEDAGLRVTDLADLWGTSRSFVTQLLNGDCRSIAREHEFADLVGHPWEELFNPPERVYTDGYTNPRLSE